MVGRWLGSPIKRTPRLGEVDSIALRTHYLPLPLPTSYTDWSRESSCCVAGGAAMAIPLLLLLLLAMSTGSDGAFCVCKPDQSPAAMQKAIDYACWRGADCTQIMPSGACSQPSTIVAHCSYATNSYFQKNSPIGATCDFGGVATLTNTDPSSGTCKYPASASGVGTGTGMGTGGTSTGTGTNTGAGTGTGVGAGTGGAGTGTGTGAGMGTGTGTGTGMGTGAGVTAPGSTTGTQGGALSPPFGGAYGPSTGAMNPDYNVAAPERSQLAAATAALLAVAPLLLM
uniref:X8 domain-containing protein n=1 Tax=Leersia perrieri TaxID=77586 RepID=A0A0D9WIK3_9ORYZ